MKKCIKSIMLISLAAVCLGITSCAKTPTVEEIYEKVDQEENAKIVMKVEFDAAGGSAINETVIEMEGDKYKLTTSMTVNGQASDDSVTYADKDYVYSKDADGNWKKTAVDDDGEADLTEPVEVLFDDDHYEAFDKSSKKYVMKEGARVDLDGMIVTNAEIEVENDAYTLRADIEVDGTHGSLTLRLSDFGDISLDLPKVDR